MRLRCTLPSCNKIIEKTDECAYVELRRFCYMDCANRWVQENRRFHEVAHRFYVPRRTVRWWVRM